MKKLFAISLILLLDVINNSPLAIEIKERSSIEHIATQNHYYVINENSSKIFENKYVFTDKILGTQTYRNSIPWCREVEFIEANDL